MIPTVGTHCEFCGAGSDCAVCGRSPGVVRACIMPVAPRQAPPDEKTDAGSDLAFRVWASDAPVNPDDPLPWKCVACFRFLLESLDFLDYCRSKGIAAYFQSPNGVRRV